MQDNKFNPGDTVWSVGNSSVTKSIFNCLLDGTSQCYTSPKNISPTQYQLFPLEAVKATEKEALELSISSTKRRIVETEFHLQELHEYLEEVEQLYKSKYETQV